MKKIAILSPEESKLAEIKKLLADYEREIIFQTASIHNGLEAVKSLIRQGVEIILARGESATVIERTYPEIIVVNVPITGFDLVQALENARRYGENIAVVAFPSSTAQIERLEGPLGVHIKRYNLLSKDVEHVDAKIDTALRDGADVILGGFITTDIARKRNLPCVQIIPGNQAYVDAFFNAKSLLASIEQEKRKTGFIKTVLNHAYEGILSIDEHGRIISVNPAAQRMLRGTEIAGQSIGVVWPELGLDGTVQTGREEFNRLVAINGMQVLCNKVPIKDGKKIVGAVATFQDITKIQMAEARIRKEVYAKGHIAAFRFTDIYGTSKAIQSTIAMAKSFAVTDANVLITGETGSGKEVFAQSIHNYSRRSQGPFVALNCAAIPAQLLESELFGYVSGAFTGANREGKPGLFEVAHTGTIFLDEIGELDYQNQGRLLRVLQERAVVRVGSDRVLPVDVRIIAATNKNLIEMVAQNKFREDLFYRLNVLHLEVPPLRERKKDIGVYAKRFLQELARDKKIELSRGARRVLEEQRWAGNIRELKNIMERIVAIARQEVVSAAFVKKMLDMKTRNSHDNITEEARAIMAALDSSGGRIGDAAKMLQINRSTLWRKMNSLGIKR
ncbi:MAG: sigma 54-interacting transcriptional regulator [Negativicutes bacterium]|nr:sigma 54-interacting transcriptional regulator [Negativicutes bacterium]